MDMPDQQLGKVGTEDTPNGQQGAVTQATAADADMSEAQQHTAECATAQVAARISALG